MVGWWSICGPPFPYLVEFWHKGIEVRFRDPSSIRMSLHRNLSFEVLEDRYVFDAGLGLAIGLGPVDEGTVADEFVVTGLPQQIAAGQTVALSDSSHVFIYGDIGNNSIDVFARITPADGHPGPPSQLLRSIPAFQNEALGFDAVGIDNNQFVLTWYEADGVRAQIFDQGLNAISGVINVDQFNGQGPTQGSHDQFLDVFQLQNGDIVFAYIDADNGSVNVQGMNSHLTSMTTLHWSSSPNSDAFNLELDQFDDSSIQLSWTLSTPGNASTWTIETVSFENNSFIGSDSFNVNGFLNEPEIEFQGGGEAIVAGMRIQNGELTTVIETFDQNQNLVNSYSTGPNTVLIDGTDQLVVGPDGSYSVLLVDNSNFSPRTFLSTFNSEGQLIGTSQQLNQSGVFPTPSGTVAALENGGFATYWVGWSLDQTSPALFSRTIDYDQTVVDIDLIDTAGQLSNPENFQVRIEGIPHDAGLNIGKRIGVNEWVVPLDEVDQVRILTFGERPPLNLAFQLMSGDLATTLAQTGVIFGSEDDDVIVPTFDAKSIFGSDGVDRLVLNSGIDDYLIDQISASQFQLTNTQSAVEFVFQGLEEFLVDGQVFTLSEFVDATNAPDTLADDYDIPVNAPPFVAPPQPPLPPLNLAPNGSAAVAELIGSQPHDANVPDTPGERQDSKRSDPPENSLDKEKVKKVESEKNTNTKPDVTAIQPDVAKSKSTLPSTNENEALDDPQTSPQANHQTGQVVQERPSQPNPLPAELRHQQPLPRSDQFSPEVMATENNRSNYPEKIGPITNVRLVEPNVFAEQVRPAFNQAALFREMEAVEQELVDETRHSEILVGAGIVVAAGFSLAQVGLLLRSSALLTKLMTSLPICVSFDPLPLLSNPGAAINDTDSTESLLDIVNAEES